jgi:hypothetical protein
LELETASPRAAQKRRKTDHAPFREVERLEEDLLHHFERVAKRLENLYRGLVPVHVRISDFRNGRITSTVGRRGASKSFAILWLS